MGYVSELTFMYQFKAIPYELTKNACDYYLSRHHISVGTFCQTSQNIFLFQFKRIVVVSFLCHCVVAQVIDSTKGAFIYFIIIS